MTPAPAPSRRRTADREHAFALFPAPEKSLAPEKPSAMDKPSTSENPSPMTPATERPAAGAPRKSEANKSAVASKSSVAREQPAPARRERQRRPQRIGTDISSSRRVQESRHCQALADRLRNRSTRGRVVGERAKPVRATARARRGLGSPSDRYDVYVTGSAPADINAKLSGKGLSAERRPAACREAEPAVARCRGALEGFAVDGLKVQVRAPPAIGTRAGCGERPIHRDGDGPCIASASVRSTTRRRGVDLRELEQKAIRLHRARRAVTPGTRGSPPRPQGE